MFIKKEKYLFNNCIFIFKRIKKRILIIDNINILNYYFYSTFLAYEILLSFKNVDQKIYYIIYNLYNLYNL